MLWNMDGVYLVSHSRPFGRQQGWELWLLLVLQSAPGIYIEIIMWSYIYIYIYICMYIYIYYIIYLIPRLEYDIGGHISNSKENRIREHNSGHAWKRWGVICAALRRDLLFERIHTTVEALFLMCYVQKLYAALDSQVDDTILISQKRIQTTCVKK